MGLLDGSRRAMRRAHTQALPAAHLVDHVFPPLPVRQWVLAVPKRLRYFRQRDAALQGTVLRILLSVVERVRTRVLSTFVKRGPIDKDDAAEMRAWAHDGGFSVDGSVRIEGTDRTGLERLLRYCARPPFALEHLHQHDAEHLVYRNPKPVRTTVPGARPAALVLTPLELITKIAALVPPPRAHRHRYYGVLAPKAPLRSVVTALAPAAVAPATTSAATREEPRHRAVARYLWAALQAQQDGAGQDPARIATECCWRASMKSCR